MDLTKDTLIFIAVLAVAIFIGQFLANRLSKKLGAEGA